MNTPTFRAGATVTHPHFPLRGLPEQAVVVELHGNGSAELDNGLFLPTEELTLADTGEEWKDIAGYDGRYRISSHGKVVATRFNRQARERVVKPQRAHDYPLVKLYAEDKAFSQVGINRLVAEHFCEPPAEARLTHLIPKDKNNLNLRWDNLRWVDPAETEDEAVAARLRKSGADHYRNKLTPEQVAEAMLVDMKRGRRAADAAPGPTLSELALRFGVSRQALAGACRAAQKKTPSA